MKMWIAKIYVCYFFRIHLNKCMLYTHLNSVADKKYKIN